MTVSSSTAQSATPVFFEIGVNDVFTNGKNGPVAPRVISINAYRPDKPLGERTFTRIINPEAEVAAQSTERYGLTADALKNAPKFGEVWQEFRAWAADGAPADSKVIPVAHRIYKFTSPVLKSECQRTEQEYGFDKEFDTSYLAYCVKNKKWKDWSLPQILKDLGLPEDQFTGENVFKVYQAMTGQEDPSPTYPAMLSSHPIKAVAEASRASTPQAVATAAKVHDVAVRVIFYDTETDDMIRNGVAPRIVEFAAYDPGRDEYFTSLVNNERHISEGASRVNHIEDHMVASKPTWKEVWPKLKAWIETPVDGVIPRIVMVAHNNFGFDLKVMKAEGDRIGEPFPRNWKQSCSLYLTRSLRLDRPHKLQSLRERYGIELKAAHRADDDTRVLYEVFMKLIGNTPWNLVAEEMAKPGNKPIVRLRELINAHGGPAPEGQGGAPTPTSGGAPVKAASSAAPQADSKKTELTREQKATRRFYEKHKDDLPPYAMFQFIEVLTDEEKREYGLPIGPQPTASGVDEDLAALAAADAMDAAESDADQNGDLAGFVVPDNAADEITEGLADDVEDLGGDSADERDAMEIEGADENSYDSDIDWGFDDVEMAGTVTSATKRSRQDDDPNDGAPSKRRRTDR